MCTLRLMQYAETTGTVSFLLLSIIQLFLSHEVSSITLLPLFMQIGQLFKHPHMFVLVGTLALSVDMRNGRASFRNMTIYDL